MADMPTYAYLRGKGRVRILEYVGNGIFRVLTSRDEIVRVQRGRLVMAGERKS